MGFDLHEYEFCEDNRFTKNCVKGFTFLNRHRGFFDLRSQNDIFRGEILRGWRKSSSYINGRLLGPVWIFIVYLLAAHLLCFPVD